ncbi:MAG: hypothetical protein ACYDAR_20255 [Thermomicrobiales bacterium]
MRGEGPKAIHADIEQKYGENTTSYRTVQRIVAELTPKDASGLWRLRDDQDGEDAALILPVVQAAIEMSAGKLRGVTVAQSRWIARLRRVAPELGERIVFYLAHVFVRAETDPRGPIEDTELWLAFAPWRSDEARARYFRAVREGWIGTGRDAERVWIESVGQTTLTYRAGRRDEVPDAKPTQIAEKSITRKTTKRGGSQ